jgi:TRAP-type C4-dicarboxylate transport system substrate-binding protein
MAFSELFTSLQQGVVDGQENPIPVILSAKFSQVQKHLSLTGHVYSPSLLLVSPKLWNSLSDADKANFREAARVGAAAQRKKVNDDEAAGIAQLRSEGMEVVTTVDGPAFRSAMSPVWSEFAKKYGADNIRRIQEFK